MAETASTDNPSWRSLSRPRSRKPAIVDASTLVLDAEGVIHRQGDGFRLDQSRVASLRLRASGTDRPRCGDAEHALAKAARLWIRTEEKQRELVRRIDVNALIDGIAGVT
jgi:hypothetical protein